MRQSVHLRPRLEAVQALLGKQRIVADIGCDHGRLGVALLQRARCARVIAIDVSRDSIKKAEALMKLTHTEPTKMILRLGDGFTALSRGETDAVVLAGMGGTLMTRLLQACAEPLQGAQIGVFQPMRAVEDIRRYLHKSGFSIIEDCIVRDAGRLYQVFSARPGSEDPLPQGWPRDCYAVGYRALLQREALLPELCEHMLRQHEKRLKSAEGTRGYQALLKKAEQMRTVLRLWERLQSVGRQL